MIPSTLAEAVLSDIRSSSTTGNSFRQAAMQALSKLPGYDWCGVYRLQDGVLVLGEYVGAATDHTRIPVGIGVCGTAVKENKNIVVEDVRNLENYLACSLQTRSEIVVLIRKDDKIVGQIDIDGHKVGTFDETDEKFLECLAALIAEHW